jgi:hypothetical protein
MLAHGSTGAGNEGAFDMIFHIVYPALKSLFINPQNYQEQEHYLRKKALNNFDKAAILSIKDYGVPAWGKRALHQRLAARRSMAYGLQTGSEEVY